MLTHHACYGNRVKHETLNISVRHESLFYNVTASKSLKIQCLTILSKQCNAVASKHVLQIFEYRFFNHFNKASVQCCVLNSVYQIMEDAVANRANVNRVS